MVSQIWFVEAELHSGIYWRHEKKRSTYKYFFALQMSNWTQWIWHMARLDWASLIFVGGVFDTTLQTTSSWKRLPGGYDRIGTHLGASASVEARNEDWVGCFRRDGLRGKPEHSYESSSNLGTLIYLSKQGVCFWMQSSCPEKRIIARLITCVIEWRQKMMLSELVEKVAAAVSHLVNDGTLALHCNEPIGDEVVVDLNVEIKETERVHSKKHVNWDWFWANLAVTCKKAKLQSWSDVIQP